MESLKIVPRTSGVLAALEAAMPSQHHRTRFGVQLQAEGAYLVALLDGAPVGHVLLRWRPIDPTLIRHGISAPNVEALGVAKPHRSRGVATALMRSVEETARAKGQAAIGLEVGVENVRARALYLRLGYWETEIPPFEVTWTYRDGRGAERVEGETCTYFTKRLALED